MNRWDDKNDRVPSIAEPGSGRRSLSFGNLNQISRSTRILLSIAMTAAQLLSGTAMATSDLTGSETEWPHVGGGVESQQYSAVAEVNTGNVSQLGLLRAVELPVKEGLVGNPLIKDGVAYNGAPRGGVVAVDLRSGKVLWSFEPTLDYSHASPVSIWMTHINRGLDMDEDKVYTTAGCNLFSIDRKTGQQLWHTVTCDSSRDLGSTSAPRAAAGKVFVGIENIERGSGRGYAAAFDAKSGKELWRFYTVPGDPSKPYENPQMEMAAKTWGPNYWKTVKGGGAGSVWDGMVYDPRTDLLLFGTGNPAPHGSAPYFEWLGTHEMLFSDSIIAVSASTGKYAWHYQLVSGDAWGIGDATGHMVLADLPLRGGIRHVLISAEKQYNYVLDAKTGEFISAGAYVPQKNFTMDPKSGKVTPHAALKFWEHLGSRVVVEPGAWGGHSWILSAFNPQTHIQYIPSLIVPQEYSNKGESAYDYGLNPGAKAKASGRLVAWDPIAQKEVWRVEQPMVFNGGALATAGNLIFQGTSDGEFNAFDATTGKRVWTFPTHSIILAGPSTVELDGKQVIVVPAGDSSAANTVRYFRRGGTTPQTFMAPSRLLIFGLGGNKTLPESPQKVLPKPSRPRPSAESAKAGASLFNKYQCSMCHGDDMNISGLGRIPDLRTMNEDQMKLMPAILRDGLFLPLGMPKFSNLTDSDITAIQAYIEQRAWEDYEAQTPSQTPAR